MSDIVERLLPAGCADLSLAPDYDLRREAAEEIERLRQERADPTPEEAAAFAARASCQWLVIAGKRRLICW